MGGACKNCGYGAPILSKKFSEKYCSEKCAMAAVIKKADEVLPEVATRIATLEADNVLLKQERNSMEGLAEEKLVRVSELERDLADALAERDRAAYRLGVEVLKREDLERDLRGAKVIPCFYHIQGTDEPLRVSSPDDVCPRCAAVALRLGHVMADGNLELRLRLGAAMDWRDRFPKEGSDAKER